MNDSEMKKLRISVLEKGQSNRDRSLIPIGVLTRAPRGALKGQIAADRIIGYKLYDALTMWLGQAEFWTEEEKNYLVWLAGKYLNAKQEKKKCANQ